MKVLLATQSLSEAAFLSQTSFYPNLSRICENSIRPSFVNSRVKEAITTQRRPLSTLLFCSTSSSSSSSIATTEETPMSSQRQREIVTIFSISNCPFCTRAKSLLTSNGVPFIEINLSHYPQKRADMLTASDSWTVPQIFFGNTHMGGSDDLTQWFETHSAADIASNYGLPTMDQLVVPTYPPAETSTSTTLFPRSYDTFPILVAALSNSSNNEDDKIVLVSNNPYVDIALALERRLELSTVDGHKKVICQTDLEQFVSSLVGTNQVQSAMEELLTADMIVPAFSFKNNTKYYRLYQHSQPLVLNSFRKWKEDSMTRDVNPMELVHQLKFRLDNLISKYTDNGLVDYISLATDVEFVAWDESSCELQDVSLLTMNEPTRLAFGIMWYNIMIKHAFIKIGTPNVPVGPFFEHVQYNVGGMLFSFSDLENGILRGNRIPPGHEKPLFSDKDDDRRNVCLSQVDQRIHFALNCGASSCPPIKTYTAEAIDEELRIVAMAFAEDNNNVRLDGNTIIYLNQIFNWYGKDFGNNPTEVANTLLSYLRGQKRQQLERMLEDGIFQLEFMPYDWSTDAKIPRPFVLEHFKMDPSEE